MANAPRYKGNKGKFLREFVANPARTTREICSKAGVAESSFYTWMREDEDFAAYVEKIRSVSVDRLRQILSAHVEEVAERYLELAKQNEDKRTALEALHKIAARIEPEEAKDKQLTKIEFEWS